MRIKRPFSDQPSGDEKDPRSPIQKLDDHLKTIQTGLPEQFWPPKKDQSEPFEPPPYTVIHDEFEGIAHDVRSPFNVINGFLSLTFDQKSPPSPEEKKQFINFVITGFNTLHQEALDAIVTELIGFYPKETLSTSDLSNLFTQTLENQGLSLQVINPPQELNVTWSQKWYTRLLLNIHQNTLKAALLKARHQEKVSGAPTTLTLRFRQTEIKHQPFLDIIFEDDAIGYPGPIVIGGFQPHLTDWQDAARGTGIGMAYQAKVLAEHYQGQVLPRVKRDDKGKVTGAQLVVRLPQHSP